MRETIQIIDSQSGQTIDAEIFDEITLEHFIETQADWRPVVLDAARALSKDPNRAMLIPRQILQTFKERFPALEYTDDQFKDKRISFLM